MSQKRCGDEEMEAHAKAAASRIPTGYADLDNFTCGLGAGELWVLASRPSVGKSALLTNLACNLACRDEPISVLLCSMEQSGANVEQRIACIMADVNLHELRRGKLSDAKAKAYGKSLTSLQSQTLPLFVCKDATQSVLTIAAKATDLKETHNLSVLMVDCLQLVREPHHPNREQEVAYISRGLRHLANDLDIAVVACAQLNRGPESRQDPRPRLSEIRESGAVEADADTVLLLHRPEMHEPGQYEGILEVIVAKQRNGPTGEVTLTFEKPTLRVKNFVFENQFSM